MKQKSRKAKRQQLTAGNWSLYIAKCADGSFYTGIAKDVEKRIEVHNSGKGSKYTAAHGPVTLIFREPQADYSAALRREYQIKTLPKNRKVRLVSGESLLLPGKKGKMSFHRKPSRKKRGVKKRNRSPLRRKDAKRYFFSEK